MNLSARFSNKQTRLQTSLTNFLSIRISCLKFIYRNFLKNHCRMFYQETNEKFFFKEIRSCSYLNLLILGGKPFRAKALNDKEPGRTVKS